MSRSLSILAGVAFAALAIAAPASAAPPPNDTFAGATTITSFRSPTRSIPPRQRRADRRTSGPPRPASHHRRPRASGIPSRRRTQGRSRSICPGLTTVPLSAY